MNGTTSPTLTELVSLYCRHHPSLDEGTRKLYGYAVATVQKHFGRIMRCRDCSEDNFLDWMAARSKQVSPKTLKRERGELLTLWRFARKRGLCSEYPVDIPPVKLPQRHPNSWTVEEYAKLSAACKSLRHHMRGTTIKKSDWWWSLTTFLFFVGCRIGAARAVERTDVMIERRIVRLRAEAAKTDYEQIIILHPKAVDAVALMLNHGGKLLWPYPYNHRQIFTQYKAILQLAGLPADRSSMFQRTRRTTYTLCVKYGSKEIASRQLGHKTDMSKFYIDESQLPPKQAADVLPTF